MRPASPRPPVVDQLRTRLEFLPRRRKSIPRIGDAAPAFCLPDADMHPFDLSERMYQSYRVLYFYPRDYTPGCVLQALDFSDHMPMFEALNCEVLGISPDDCPTHASFRDEYGLAQRLLSDEDKAICRLYGVWQSIEIEGGLRNTVIRTTFIIDRQGIIRRIFRNAPPRGHAAEVLHVIQKLETEYTHGNRKKHRRYS